MRLCFNIRNLLALLATLLVVTAFYTGAPMPREKHRVRMIIQYGNKGTADTTAYFYNSDGHIAYTQNVHTGVFGSRYHYLRGMILREYHEAMRNKNYVDTMVLNSKGLVERVKSNNAGLFFLHHEYDADRHLIRSLDVDTKGVEHLQNSFEYQNGNRNAMNLYMSGQTVWSGIYKFYPDRENTIGNENLGADFAGSDSKNLTKYESWQMTGDKPQSFRHTYQYDERGRVSVKTTYNVTTGKLSDSTAYIYYSGVRLVGDGR